MKYQTNHEGGAKMSNLRRTTSPTKSLTASLTPSPHLNSHSPLAPVISIDGLRSSATQNLKPLQLIKSRLLLPKQKNKPVLKSAIKFTSPIKVASPARKLVSPKKKKSSTR